LWRCEAQRTDAWTGIRDATEADDAASTAPLRSPYVVAVVVVLVVIVDTS
jgi:hypothetical protein